MIATSIVGPDAQKYLAELFDSAKTRYKGRKELGQKLTYEALPDHGRDLLAIDVAFATKLYHALPSEMQNECRSLLQTPPRSLRCIMILDIVYWRVSPGSAEEKEAILRYVRDPEVATNAGQAIILIQEWIRVRNGLADFGLQDIQPIECISALFKIIKGITTHSDDFNYRVRSYSNGNDLIRRPTVEKTWDAVDFCSSNWMRFEVA
jgi:hypothetical protein